MLIDPEGVEQTLELDWLCPVLPSAAPFSSAASADVEESTSAGLSRATTDVASVGTPSPTVKKETPEPEGTSAVEADSPVSGLDTLSQVAHV